MEKFFTDISDSVIRFFSDYLLNFKREHSFFLDWDYYKDLYYQAQKGTVVTGFLLVLFILFSCDIENRKTGFFKVLAITAVINSCRLLAEYIYNYFGAEAFLYYDLEAFIGGVGNIISGFIMTLVISSCYKRSGRRAFFFGLTVYTMLPFLNIIEIYQIVENNGLLLSYLAVLISAVGILSIIMSYRKYFFTSWIWYFVFHISMRFFSLKLIDMPREAPYKAGDFFRLFPDFMPSLMIDGVIFLLILLFAVIFEKGVLSLKKAETAT